MPEHTPECGQPLPEWVEWDCCTEHHKDGSCCTGAAQSKYPRCLAHLYGAELAVALARRAMADRFDKLPPHLDARGVRVDDWQRVLAVARRGDGPLRIGHVLLRKATVKGGLSLGRARVEGGVFLGGARVEGGVSLAGATVEGGVYLSWARVEGGLLLSRATVKGGLFLDSATVKGGVFLHEATVKGGLFLDSARVEDGVYADSARVEGDVSFGRARLKGSVLLNRATVEGGLSLAGATVEGGVFLREATVKGEALVGPMSASTTVSSRRAEFTGPVSLDVTAERVELSGARLLGGLTARIAGAEVVMEQVELKQSAVLRGRSRGSTAVSSPRLLRLAGTDVASLTLTEVDLRACHFSGAVNLDKMHIDGSLQFDVRQDRWHTRRLWLAEEPEWLDEHAPKLRWNRWWYYNERRPYLGVHAEHASTRARERAQGIATVYRALRKGREDSKDEPGSADFYYGEMEMRRKGTTKVVDRGLLTTYWLLSGYGLRAWRAMTALVVITVLATAVFTTVGFRRTRITECRPTPTAAAVSKTPSYRTVTINGPCPGWRAALDYSLQSATSLARPQPTPLPLYALGRAMEMFLRFAGPGLLALAVLAIRARVKR